jgi:hypothetical protein
LNPEADDREMILLMMEPPMMEPPMMEPPMMEPGG